MKEKEDNDEKELLLSKPEVWNVLDFARFQTGIYDMPMNIDLLNQRLKEISLLDTGAVTEEEVANALSSPKSSERELLRQSESFEVTSQIYKRLLNYLGNIPSFDWNYTCVTMDEKDYKNEKEYKRYLKDLAIVRDFFDRFDYKKEFSKISRQLLRQEAFFSVFRDDGKKFVFQELPPERVKITGRWDYGILFSFDYYYFLQGGVDIDLYPDIFLKTLANLDEISQYPYDPSEEIWNRGSRGFAQWVDCSPADNFWMFKLSPEIVTRIPFFSGMFPDLAQESVIRALQKSSYMASAAKIILGEVPFIKNSKSEQINSIALTPDLLGKFLSLVKSSIDNDAVRVGASPLQNVKGFDFESDNDIRSSYLKTTLGASGVSSNLLFAADVKPNTLETQLSLAVDEIMMKSIYPQMEGFLEYFVNRLTKKHKFKFKMEGSNFYTDSDRRMKVAQELAERGMVLPQLFASAQGMNPFDFERQMAEARASDWMEKLTPMPLASQMPNESEEDAGRPEKDASEISDSGSETKGGGGNDNVK